MRIYHPVRLLDMLNIVLRHRSNESPSIESKHIDPVLLKPASDDLVNVIAQNRLRVLD